MTDHIKVVYCLDENYRKYAEKSIQSVLKYNPKAEITIVSIKPMNIMGLKNIQIPIGEGFRKRGTNDRISTSAYLKLYLTELPNEYRKVIYLDADVICHKPLKELWKMSCTYIQACKSHNYGKEQALDLGLETYFNTGVMVMNLDALRKFEFTKKCFLVQRTANPKLWCHDETCINVAMNNKIEQLPQVYNVCVNREYDTPIPSKDIYISHYIGKNKESMLSIQNYESLDNLKNIIKGRSVAIVGNAKSIFNRRNGALIDNHDVVIRFNRGFITQPISQGKNTTILMIGTDMDSAEVMKFGYPITVRRSTRYTTPSKYTIGIERSYLRNRIGSQPSTGFMAIDMCLSMGAKNIHLFGFDFEKTPTFYNPDGYETRHDYQTEKALVSEYVYAGLLKIH